LRTGSRFSRASPPLAAPTVEGGSQVTVAMKPPQAAGRTRGSTTSRSVTKRGAAARLRSSPWLLAATRLAVVLVLLTGYQLFSLLNPSRQGTFPPLQSLWGGAVTLVTTPEFWSATLYTLSNALIGLVISLFLGGALGLLLSIHRAAYGSTRFIVDFMRAIPPLGLIPLGLLILGPTVEMEITLIVIAVLWLVLVQVYFGVMNVDPKLLETARSFRMPAWRRILFVTIPAISPSFATAVRLSATLCLLLALGTELLAGSSGLGSLIANLQRSNLMPQAYPAIGAAALLGVLVNGVLAMGERRLLAWHYRTIRKAVA